MKGNVLVGELRDGRVEQRVQMAELQNASRRQRTEMFNENDE